MMLTLFYYQMLFVLLETTCDVDHLNMGGILNFPPPPQYYVYS
ncbi:hypothetical protein G5S_0932 [Chlamydia pecorum E58]|uniref:Uncharacterized protein n=1 Tax=Chlamydia pecorum (strain ATCC VR-628 / DSM 29919 / E58) TaxID=331635 RepID=A0AA34WI86_CHLPE|nr:hypothetical protein G5S_0932 [Chlamydia pecorum E58]